MDIYKMFRIFIALLVIGTIGCTGNSLRKSSDTSLTNARLNNFKIPDSGSKIPIPDTSVNDSSNNENDTPTPDEERKRLSGTYGDIKMIDSTIIDKEDTLSFHLKYYCLKEINILVPYNDDEKGTKNFVTHPFASHILLIHNGDTVLKKQFQANSFSPFFKDKFGGHIKKYGSMSMPYLSRGNKDKTHIVLICSIGIPSTDIGIDLYLIIEKNGRYSIVEKYP
ncbi:hypothetical protein [Mucilaginibacter flavidus]|uniref:hypothetical protein n=1 Tax=Mucilaginibacter flavidus TaxID=2949309 RepID=UPI002092C69C|nr:hypothetical protein [Mucilaginibacter flavidus]MCO5949949.1 hypothetical protein [Mucilaginibacter flavidus]